MIVMVTITLLMLIGLNKSPLCLLWCFASYSATLMKGWNNFGQTPLPLTVFIPYNFTLEARTNVTKKKDRILIKDLLRLSIYIEQKKQGWFTVGNIYFFVNNISEGTAFLLRGLTYSDKVKLRHTHSTLQVKPDLSLITSTVTLKTSFTWYNATTALNCRVHRWNQTTT